MKNIENKKVMIIGLDGATFDLIKPWVNDGELPSFKRITEDGCYGILESTIPHITPPAWTSMTTGKNPGKHGIFDFMSMERTGDSWKLKLYNSRSKKSKEIWDYLDNKKSIVVNVPLTYPPRPINGIMITGMFTPDIKNSDFTYPKEFKREILKSFPDYVIELNWNIYKGKERKFLEDLYKMTEERIKLFWYLFEKEWDFLFFVFVGTDRMQHIIWDEKKLLGYYQYLDKFLGKVLNALENKNINLFLVSDHGFSKIKKSVHINTLLKEEGFLEMRRNNENLLNKLGISKERLSQFLVKYKLSKIYTALPPKILHIIRKSVPGKSNPVYDLNLENSIAAMVGSGSIFITEKNSDNLKEIKSKLKSKLENLKDPDTKEKIIEKVFRKEEIYSGPMINKAPDLLLLPTKGYSLVHEVATTIIERPNFKKADHALNGIFLAYGPGVKKGNKIENAKIYDIAPTILHILGSPIPNDMDGKVLKEIFEEDSEFAKRKPKYLGSRYYDNKREGEKIKKAIKELKLKGKNLK